MESRFSTLGVERLVEKQLRNWEIRKAQVPEAPETVASRVHPYVAISRMASSGGADIAAKLHQRLGWPVVDQQILDFMARDDRTRRMLYDLMDERDLGMVNEMLLPVITGIPLKQQDYYRRLTEAALSFAQTESAIFLGRGIGYILPARVGLHVCVVAGAETRISKYARRHNLSKAQAQAQLEKVEKERQHFLTTHFGEDAREPYRFDLVLNTDRFAADEAAELIFYLIMKKKNAR